MSRLSLDRATLASLLQGNPRAISAFEKMLSDVGGTLPDTIEQANALAAQALAAAQVALSMLAVLAEALGQLESAPVTPPLTEPDDHAPRAHLGTISTQNADQVEVTGGTIDGTPIGQTTAAAGKFTTLAASEQITSTVADGTPPLVVGSTTLVDNLHVARAAQADHAGTADALASPTTLPAAATDLPTTITLVNALRDAAISKGL